MLNVLFVYRRPTLHKVPACMVLYMAQKHGPASTGDTSNHLKNMTNDVYTENTQHLLER